MKSAKDFFSGEVFIAMKKNGFRNFLIQDFLTSLLVSNINQVEDGGPFLARQEKALALDFRENCRNLEHLDNIGKRLLFSIGFFPESLMAKRKRMVGLGYYIMMEKVLASKLAARKEIWLQLRKNMDPIIVVLFNVRLNVNIKRPDMVTFCEMISCTKNTFN